MTLKIGSLCTGYGGLDMAVEAVLDARTAWVSDIDKGACKVLAHRYPGVPNLGDMTAIDWTQVEPVDVITGGTPCQDLSHAGKRAGMTEGTRSNLWVAMREAIATIRPSLVIWENVGGAYSAEADSELVSNPRLLADTRRRDGEPVLRALGRVLGDLSSLGYVGGWHGLRAADVGAPHGRLRVFVVAVPAADTGSLAREVPAGRGLAAVPELASDGNQGRALLPTPTAASDGNTPETHLARKPGRTEVTNLEVMARGGLLPTPRATDGTKGGPNQRGSSGDLMLPSAVAQMLPTPSASRAGGTAERYLDRLEAADGSRRTNCSNLDLVAASGSTEWGQYGAAIAHWETLTRPAPAPTETGPKGNPRLSPLFTEWMMGLPAGWITDVPDVTRNEALKLCGNGVVPQQAEAAIRFLLPIVAGLEVAA